MSPRDSFWFLAGALVTVAIMVTVRAWLRGRPVQTVRAAIPAFAVPIAAALALVGVALGIYFLLGSPSSIGSTRGTASESGASMQVASASPAQQQAGQSSASAGSLDDVTQRLAARLAAKGGSDSEWTLLAESYDYMGRTADAKAARVHVASAAPSGRGGSGNTGPAGAAAGEQMAAIAAVLDSPAAAAAAGTAQISGTVQITAKLALHAAAGATLFIYATQPNAPGPPLAVLRVRAEHWPVTFTLNDANAMIPGRNLSNALDVQIEARISRSGDALPQSGDLVGSVTNVNPRAGRPVKISIDREIG